MLAVSVSEMEWIAEAMVSRSFRWSEPRVCV